jgi:hypothetical protein
MQEAKMRAPIPLMLRKGPHAVTQKLLAGVLVASLSFIVVAVLVSRPTKPAASVAPVAARISLADPEAPDASADFLERVALSHVTTPKSVAPGDADAATNELSGDSAVPLPPRRRTALQDHSHAGKVASNVQASAQSNVPGNVEKAPPQAAPAVSASAAAPAGGAGDWLKRLNPLPYGAGLVANIGDFVSTTDKRVVDGMASVGDTVTSFIKKLKS